MCSLGSSQACRVARVRELPSSHYGRQFSSAPPPSAQVLDLVSCSSNGHLNMNVRPAALEAAAARPGLIVDLTANDVLARSGERCSRRRFTLGVESRSRICKRDIAWAAEFAPEQN